MLSFSLISCAIFKQKPLEIKQGVKGKIIMLKGNLMPSPDVPKAGNGKAVKRMVRIYEITNLSETEGESPMFIAVKTKLVARFETDKEGNFMCKLLPGKYSIFTEEIDSKLFANLFEGKGEITPFEVKSNRVTTYNIQINYMAFY